MMIPLQFVDDQTTIRHYNTGHMDNRRWKRLQIIPEEFGVVKFPPSCAAIVSCNSGRLFLGNNSGLYYMILKRTM